MFRQQVVILLQAMDIPEHLIIERILFLGRWKEGGESYGRGPRPSLVELADPRHIDKSMTAPDRITIIISGQITKRPDGTTIGRSTSKDPKCGSTGFNISWIQTPSPASTKLGGGNNRRPTHAVGLAGKWMGGCILGDCLEQTLVVPVQVRNQEKEAENASDGVRSQVTRKNGRGPRE